MMKLFRVHHVHANGLETLALTVSAGGLKSAVKRVREHPLIRLPNGTYYIFEAGNYTENTDGELRTIRPCHSAAKGVSPRISRLASFTIST